MESTVFFIVYFLLFFVGTTFGILWSRAKDDAKFYKRMWSDEMTHSKELFQYILKNNEDWY